MSDASATHRRQAPKAVLWRGVRRRCPHCGQGPVFVRWMTMHDTCRVCGLRYLRNQGDTWLYWIVMDRIPLAIGLILVVFFGVSALTWQSGVLFLVAHHLQRGLRDVIGDPSDTFEHIPVGDGWVRHGTARTARRLDHLAGLGLPQRSLSSTIGQRIM